MAFFGDGAPAQGAFHEALNLAAVWQLPVIFFCENNGYAEFSPTSTQHAASLEQRAAGYGIDYVAVDGNDVVATAAAMEERGPRRPRREAAPPSSKPPPTAGTATTKAIPSATDRRTRSEEWEARDPLLVHERRLREAGVGDDEIKALESSVADELDGAVEAARRLPAPDAAALDRLRPPGEAGTSRSPHRRPTTRRCSAPWTPSMPRSRPSSPATTGCSSPASTSGRAATSSG